MDEGVLPAIVGVVQGAKSWKEDNNVEYSEPSKYSKAAMEGHPTLVGPRGRIEPPAVAVIMQ